MEASQFNLKNDKEIQNGFANLIGYTTEATVDSTTGTIPLIILQDDEISSTIDYNNAEKTRISNMGAFASRDGVNNTNLTLLDETQDVEFAELRAVTLQIIPSANSTQHLLIHHPKDLNQRNSLLGLNLNTTGIDPSRNVLNIRGESKEAPASSSSNPVDDACKIEGSIIGGVDDILASSFSPFLDESTLSSDGDGSSTNKLVSNSDDPFVKTWVDTDGESCGASSSPQSSSQFVKSDEVRDDDEPSMPELPLAVDIKMEGDEEEDEEMKPTLKCSTCFKTFDNPMTLQVHIRLHTGERPYKCKCGEAFIHYTYLDYHIKNSHDGTEPTEEGDNGSGDTPKSSKKKSENARTAKKKSATSNARPSRKGSQNSKPTIKKTDYTNVNLYQGASSSSSTGEQFVCPYCDISFRYASGLITHLKMHKGDKPFKCRLCKAAFEKSQQLEDHRKSIHLNPSSSQGSDKKLTTTPSSTPKRKLSRSDSESSNSYPQAPVFAKKSDVTLQEKSQIKKPASPPLYKEVTDKNGSVKKIYVCSYCNKTFPAPDNLKTHIRTHTGERPFPCLRCPQRFRQKCHMEKHMKVVHAIGKTYPYKCSKCDTGYCILANLQRHLKEVHGVDDDNATNTAGSTGNAKGVSPTKRENKNLPYKCPRCPISFRRKKNMLQHVNTAHAAPGGKFPFKCTECECGYLSFVLLKRHLKLEHGIELEINNANAPAPAQSITMRRRKRKALYFSTRKNVNNRATVYNSSKRTEPKQHQQPQGKPKLKRCFVMLTRCDDLAKKLNEAKQKGLKTLRSTWSSDMPVVFSKSGIKRSLGNSRLASRKLHSKYSFVDNDDPSKPFPCSTCNKRFRDKSGLADHMRIHTGERPFGCHYCGMRFTRWTTRYNHVRRHEKQKEKLAKEV